MLNLNITLVCDILGKTCLADLVSAPMLTTGLLMTNRSFSLAVVNRPVNLILQHEYSPGCLELSVQKVLWEGTYSWGAFVRAVDETFRDDA